MDKYPKIKTLKQFENAWEAYKHECDNQMVLSHVFCSKTSEFVSKELKHRITYSINGFCSFLKLSRSTFHNIYENNEIFSDLVARIREECEVDELKKLQTGEISIKLSEMVSSGFASSPKNKYKPDINPESCDNCYSESLNLKPLSDIELDELHELADKIDSK